MGHPDAQSNGVEKSDDSSKLEPDPHAHPTDYDCSWGCWTHVLRHWMERFFFSVGKWVGTHPKRAILLGLLMAFGCACGFLRGSFEISTTDQNWLPRETQGWRDFQKVRAASVSHLCLLSSCLHVFMVPAPCTHLL